MRGNVNAIKLAMDNRGSVLLAGDQIEELKEKFVKLDINGNSCLEMSELREALKACGIDIPGYEARLIEENFKKVDANRNGKLSLQEFEALYTDLKSKKESRDFKKAIKPLENTTVIRNDEKNTGIVHTVRHSEQLAFSKWINQNLANDPDLNLARNPINPETKDLYTRCDNGLVLCKLINFSAPKTIDERSINKSKQNQSLSIYQKLENLELALRSAEAIGCQVINIRPSDIHEAKEHLILGLLWQIIQIGLFSEINLAHHPGLVLLLRDGETKEDLLKLTKEELLLRWMNYHLERSAYSGKEVKNFSADIKDSIPYTYLLKQISPAGLTPPVTLNPLQESNVNQRAEKMLCEADKLNAREFVTSNDVVQGNQKLNMAFVANLFNTYPALDITEEVQIEEEDVIEETREEKTYRNWMNSMGVKPFVNYIYEDLSNGLVIFQLYDIIKPGIVNWKRVNDNLASDKNKFKINFLILDNCNYAIEIGKAKPMNFKLVGIQGSNLKDKDKMFTLALVWQLMRAYILSLLQKLAGDGKMINENTIVEWTNQKLAAAGKKSFIQNFQDPVIADSKVICDLIDSIKPNTINYSVLKSDNSSESKMDNARYAVSMARKIGARVFALPEDIVEVKQKMVMTIFATLMVIDYQPSGQ